MYGVELVSNLSLISTVGQIGFHCTSATPFDLMTHLRCYDRRTAMLYFLNTEIISFKMTRIVMLLKVKHF